MEMLVCVYVDKGILWKSLCVFLWAWASAEVCACVWVILCTGWVPLQISRQEGLCTWGKLIHTEVSLIWFVLLQGVMEEGIKSTHAAKPILLWMLLPSHPYEEKAVSRWPHVTGKQNCVETMLSPTYLQNANCWRHLSTFFYHGNVLFINCFHSYYLIWQHGQIRSPFI